jgi:hypothetical protein
MTRVPDTGPEAQERRRLVSKLQADLYRFQNIPKHRRVSECADEGEQTCRTLLRDLGVDV